jgi:hypothetical protein
MAAAAAKEPRAGTVALGANTKGEHIELCMANPCQPPGSCGKDLPTGGTFFLLC